MALKRLLLGISALSVVCVNAAIAQFQPATANQDGIIILDSIGRFFSAPLGENNIGRLLFKELESTSQRFGFVAPVVRDMELVGNSDGSPKGAYVVDAFGGQFALNLVSSPGSTISGPMSDVASPMQLAENNPRFSKMPYFGIDVIKDIEISPDWRQTTFGYKGYLLLDSDGVVHAVGENNLPKYVVPFVKDYTGETTEEQFVNSSPYLNSNFVRQLGANGEIIAEATYTLFPETFDLEGSTVTVEQLLQRNEAINFPISTDFAPNANSVKPVYTYFGAGTDIARDLEISVEYTQVTVPVSLATQLAAGAVSGLEMPTDLDNFETRTIALTNGYYILDGAGVVHSCRLPLDFDVDNDGEILFNTDLISFPDDGGPGELNPVFGEPINFAPLSPPWIDDRENLPYFGYSVMKLPNGEERIIFSDFAVDIEITPSGKGFYLLDVFGGVFAAGDAHFNFPPKINEQGQMVRTDATTPYFGFPSARDLVLIPNQTNPSLGLEANEITVGFLVIDGFGTVHKAGLAETFDVSEKGDNGNPVETFTPLFNVVESSPLWLPKAPPLSKFTIGPDAYAFNIAPNFVSPTSAFSSVTAAFTTITAPATP
ncbi:MAG: hypothetical protein C4527_14260 [Candidatus Omnitrophota bacterium]|jgi:hypothetical protein|nr:MAG: hypothetical protein C4527_14260 [Candidatus Omnitrophota bacterium]